VPEGQYLDTGREGQLSCWAGCVAGYYLTGGDQGGNFKSCRSCTSGRYKTNGGTHACSACTTCSAGKFEAPACTTTRNRQCSTCGGNQYYCSSGVQRSVSVGYYSTGGSSSTRTAQSPCSNQNCGSNEYRSGSCSGSNNGFQCNACQECQQGKGETTSCSATENRVCTACTPGKYKTGSGNSACSWCTPTTCSAGEEQTTECLATENRECNTCASGKYKTSSGNSACSACTTCSAGQEQTAACTTTQNRICIQCSAGKYR
jgi:hypothetical protein